MVKIPLPIPTLPTPCVSLSLSLSVWFVLWLTFADWQRMSTFLAHMCFPRFPSTYFHYNLLLFALLIFAYVMQQATATVATAGGTSPIVLVITLRRS